MGAAGFDTSNSDTWVPARRPSLPAPIARAARFGALGLKDTQIYSFQEKPSDEGGWIKGGFFVLDPKAIDAVTDDSQMFEREPIEALVAQGEVQAFFHKGFWQAMDTLRDKQHLEELWNIGKAPWKTW